MCGIQSIGIAAAHLLVSGTLHAETSGLGTVEHHWVDLLGTGAMARDATGCYSNLFKNVQSALGDVGLTLSYTTCVARPGDLTILFSGLNQSI